MIEKTFFKLAFLLGDFLAKMARRLHGALEALIKGLYEGLKTYDYYNDTNTISVSM